MAESGQRRKLAAILSADVVGYSRLMQDDDTATVETLTKYRAIFSDFVNRHEGRIVDSPGDNILAEFDSPVEAVQCAVEIQNELSRRNLQLADHRQMHFRIGINLGDILSRDDGTIYGDGVNVAARLESLAEPGGITVSGTVFDHAENKLPVAFDFTGEQQVKNIAKPVRAYRVIAETALAAPPSTDKPLTLPGKPSIAVLPFDNLSGDPEQEYFADGIAEDLITTLSHIRWMFVTARNSTFAYKGQSPDVRQVGKELAVRYVLEGSVRKGGNRVRISAQLVDASTGNHVWAQRYDRELDDLFALQDEITETLVAALQREVGEFERERAHRKPPENLDAWESYQRGLWHLWRFGAEDMVEARQWFQRAREADPDYALAYAALAYALVLEVTNAHIDSVTKNLERAIGFAKQAILFDEKEAMGYYALGRARAMLGESELGAEDMRTAIALNPNLAMAHHGLAAVLSIGEKWTESLVAADKAIALSPRDPLIWVFQTHKCQVYFLLGRYEEAVGAAQQASRHPKSNFVSHSILAAALAHLGRFEEAKRAIGRLLAVRPGFVVEDIFKSLPDPCPDSVRTAVQNWVHGLHKAGLDIPNVPTDGD